MKALYCHCPSLSAGGHDSLTSRARFLLQTARTMTMLMAISHLCGDAGMLSPMLMQYPNGNPLA